MLDRFGVAAALREIAALFKAEGANPFKVRAYQRGAQALERLRDDLATLVQEERLTRVEGIGPALAATITELVRTGTTAQLASLRSKLPPGVIELAPLLTVPKIQALQDTLGIGTLAELEEACRAGRVRTVKGFGPKTEEKLLAAIDALRTKGDALLLNQATQEADRLLGYLRESSAVTEAEIAGDLRRRVEIVDRVELVVATADPLAVAEQVAAFPAVTHVIQQDASRAVVRLAGVRVEVEMVPTAAFPALLLHRTGSFSHLEGLATHARAKGYTLGTDGLTRSGRKLRTRHEADIYTKLGLTPVPPEMREGAGEIEWAAEGGSADALVKIEDIQGMVHCHTVYSDGKNTVEEMARGAEALGMKYLTITDHSPTASYAGGLTLDRLKRQWDEIEEVQSRVKVTLLRGTESDINQDGSLDYPDAVLEQMDVVIASVHARHKMDADTMTKRVIRAMRQPRFKIWGHALGRLLNRREPFACHMEKILDAIAESRAAVEINGDPRRLDMEPRWVREARSRGIRFVVSVDAHSVGALMNLRYGIDMARRGWLTRDEVLNTRPLQAFRQAVRP